MFTTVQFDEDFESELIENRDAKAEVALLAKSCDPELTQVSRDLPECDLYIVQLIKF